MPDNLETVANYLANSRPPVNAGLAEGSAVIAAWNALVAELKGLRATAAAAALKKASKN